MPGKNEQTLYGWMTRAARTALGASDLATAPVSDLPALLRHIARSLADDGALATSPEVLTDEVVEKLAPLNRTSPRGIPDWCWSDESGFRDALARLARSEATP